jgi:hypothetical protein
MPNFRSSGRARNGAPKLLFVAARCPPKTLSGRFGASARSASGRKGDLAIPDSGHSNPKLGYTLRILVANLVANKGISGDPKGQHCFPLIVSH